ncbi:MAG: RiPP maturation radical SAM C-methyltransferase [Caldiserica bacterium]|jgi:ribosomal peptide maturation radical SAM protein 1|nr:RiPP maturation radical SAM C-methyltransferase [Caldisericota bacterium]
MLEKEINETNKGGEIEVALVCMPFASWKQPSFALSILSSCLKKEGFKTKTFYFTLNMVKEIGPWLYDKIASWHIVDLLGDWIFSKSLFPELENDEEYFEEILHGGLKEHGIAFFGKEPIPQTVKSEILNIRNKIDQNLQGWADQVFSFRPKIVGFTNLFHQQVSSLALAKKYKEIDLGSVIVMGGPNCQWPMGEAMIKNFPFLDAIFLGEGEMVFPEFVRRTIKGDRIEDLEGIITRNTQIGNEHPKIPIVSKLDEIPFPDYSIFQEQWEEVQEISQGVRGRIQFETSRGCWWGQIKSRRCLFCSQGSKILKYRKKSTRRAVEEISHFRENYPQFDICFTDEAVDPQTIKALGMSAGEENRPGDIIYIQVRPDLDKKQLSLLKSSGVKRLEVGIESLSTKVLTLIRKGVRSIQNIAFLKWCQELKIEPVWNLLWGFPGEARESYSTMSRLIPLIVHLQPPNQVGKFRLERFSPYFDQKEEFRLKSVKPFPAYKFIYPLKDEVLKNLAYFFSFELEEGDKEKGIIQLAELVDLWKKLFPRACLKMSDSGKDLIILDRRGPKEKVTILKGLSREFYLFLGEIRRWEEIQNFFMEKTKKNSRGSGEEVLLSLIKSGLVLKEGDHFLGLAVMEE